MTEQRSEVARAPANLYCYAHLPDGQKLMAPHTITDPELMWEEIAANNLRNRAIREGTHAEGPDPQPDPDALGGDRGKDRGPARAD